MSKEVGMGGFVFSKIKVSRIVTCARKLQMKLLSYSDEVYVSV